MNEIISCTVLGIASVVLGDVHTNPTGREIWTGVRIRTDAGKTRFLKGMLVEAEAALIIREAMDQGERIELWLSGKDERAYPYGIRTATEEWYGDAMAGHLRGQGIKFLILGIVTLPLLGIGVLFMLGSIGYFMNAFTFAACHSEATFKLGYEAGVLGQRSARASDERLQAA